MYISKMENGILNLSIFKRELKMIREALILINYRETSMERLRPDAVVMR